MLEFERPLQQKKVENNITTDELLRLCLGLTWSGTAYCSLPELHLEFRAAGKALQTPQLRIHED